MEVIVKYNEDLTELPVEPLGQGFGIVDVAEDQVAALYTVPGIENVELSKDLYFNDLFTSDAVCLQAARQEEGFGLSGSGTAVGIIDTGVDYTLPDFRTSGGSTRILALWDQRGQGTPPQGFTKGAEYTAREINAALNEEDPFLLIPRTDVDGHGTAVAGIAAGSGQNDSSNAGMAPGAALIVVRVGEADTDYARSVELMRAVRYTINTAKQFNMPVAINLSFGMNRGDHQGNSLFEEYLAAVSTEWKVCMTVPTGNEGGAGHHYSGRMTTGEVRDIEFFTAAGISSFYLSLWKDFTDDFSAQLILPNGQFTTAVSGENPLALKQTENYLITGVYGQPTIYNTAQEIYFQVQPRDGLIPAGLWRLRLTAGAVVHGDFNIWLPTVEQVTTGTYFTLPDNDNTITIPATARKLIRVAGYNARLGSMAEFSGVGNAGGLVPDVAAPAVGVTAARIGGGYDSFTGTSFAAPFVTGAAALMMEWGIVRGFAPGMYGETVRSFLRLGAKRRENEIYPNPVNGYGLLCVGSTLNEMAKRLF